MNPFFEDRRDAGRKLGELLLNHPIVADAIVLALPRGGVPVGAEVARILDLPLDVFVVRKLGVPGHEELAMGAIASGGARVMNDDVLLRYGISSVEVGVVIAREAAELKRREGQYRGHGFSIQGRSVIVVDDGLATGATMRAAVAALRQLAARRILIAVPVGSPETCDIIRRKVDDLICVERPDDFEAVGQCYADFGQTTDEEITELLQQF